MGYLLGAVQLQPEAVLLEGTMTTTYKITIERTETVRRVAEGPYTRVGGTDEKPVYGYAPARETEVSDRKDIYTQVVDGLNLVAVIKAINMVEESYYPFNDPTKKVHEVPAGWAP
jgi:hypothetical protein